MRLAVRESKSVAIALDNSACSAAIDRARESNTGEMDPLAPVSGRVSKITLAERGIIRGVLELCFRIRGAPLLKRGRCIRQVHGRDIPSGTDAIRTAPCELYLRLSAFSSVLADAFSRGGKRLIRLG